MSDLVPTSADEYRKKMRRVVKLTSGNVFSIKGLNAKSTVAFIGKMPKDGIKADNLTDFVSDNFDFLLTECIMPSVLEPKLEADDYILGDVIELLTSIMEVVGLGPEEAAEREKFRGSPDSPIP